MLERELQEVPHRVGRAGGHHVVARLVVLEHPPHRLDVLRGVAPVADGVEVAQVEVVLHAGRDARRPPA